MEQDIARIFELSPFSKNNPACYIDHDMVYIEDIRQLPDIQKNTEVGLNIFVFCEEGRIEIKLNGYNYSIHRQQIFICPSDLVLNDFMVSPDLKCHVLCMTDRLLKQLLRGMVDVWSRAIYIDRLNIIDCDTPEIIELMTHYYTLVKFHMEHPEFARRKEIVTAHLYAIAMDICSWFIMHFEQEQENDSVSAPDKLFNRFMVLLSGTRDKKKPVSHYASQLCISPKYLSHICRKASGKTAHKWIEEAVQEDIRYLLKDPDMTIKEIASELGFASVSFFGKYVREQMGITPLALREQLLADAP